MSALADYTIYSAICFSDLLKPNRWFIIHYKLKLIPAGLFLVNNLEVIKSERNLWPDEVKHLDSEAVPLKFLPTQVRHRLPLNAKINNFKKSMIDCTQKKPSFKQCNTTVNQYIEHVVVSLHLISQDHSDRFIYEVLTKFLSPPPQPQ